MACAGGRCPEVGIARRTSGNVQHRSTVTSGAARGIRDLQIGHDRRWRNDGEGDQRITSGGIGDGHGIRPGAKAGDACGALSCSRLGQPIEGQAGEVAGQCGGAVTRIRTVRSCEGQVHVDGGWLVDGEVQRGVASTAGNHDIVFPGAEIHCGSSRAGRCRCPQITERSRSSGGDQHDGAVAIAGATRVGHCGCYLNRWWCGDGERDRGIAAQGVRNGKCSGAFAKTGRIQAALPTKRFRRPQIRVRWGTSGYHAGRGAVAHVRATDRRGLHGGHDRDRWQDGEILHQLTSMGIRDRNAPCARTELGGCGATLPLWRSGRPYIGIARRATGNHHRGGTVAIGPAGDVRLAGGRRQRQGLRDDELNRGIATVVIGDGDAPVPGAKA